MEHISKDTFKQIFHDHWETFKAQNPYATQAYDSVIHKMLDCGDADKMGFCQYLCTYCGETRRIAFTCKSSFCLSCAKVYTDRWVEFIGRRLFPGVTYRHFILTVPDFLRTWFSQNHQLLSLLMRTGHACIQDTVNTYKRTDLDIGTVIVLHTAGRPGNFNPHLHILVTAGGINPKDQWISFGSYFPYDLLHRKWQYHLLTFLREHIQDDPAIQRDIDRGWKDYPKGFVAHIQKGAVPPSGEGLARYLAKYLVSPPISVRRIERYDGQTVRYWYRDHRTEAIQHETVPVLDFIGRMVQHILPKGFQRIRYYGTHGNIRYAQMREKIAQLLPTDTPASPLGYRVIPRKPFAELFLQTFGKDPLLCPKCGNPMILELIQHPLYGIIRDFLPSYMMECPDDIPHTEAGKSPTAQRPLDRAERVVQIPLPFM